MKLHLLSQKTLLIGALAFLVCAAVLIRVWPQSMVSSTRTTNSQASQTVATTTIPLFTSAAFFDGDIFHGVGPEWTFVSQSDLANASVPAYNPFDGTTPVRNAVIKLVGKNAELSLTEYSIKDRDVLQKKLDTHVFPAMSLAGRDGFAVPAADESGSTGFALVGTNAVLFIEYGNVQQSGMSQFPTNLEPEVQSFIAAIQIP
jgi:hypothetical protein